MKREYILSRNLFFLMLCLQVAMLLAIQPIGEAESKKSTAVETQQKKKEDGKSSEAKSKNPRATAKVPFEEVVKTQTVKEQFHSLRLAIQDIESTFPGRYNGKAYRKKLKQLERKADSVERTAALHKLQREALLSNHAVPLQS